MERPQPVVGDIKGGIVMNFREYCRLASCVCFTVAFLCLIPSQVANARTTVDNMVRTVGFSSLAIISIGLIVTWMGFINRERWTWFVMLIIVSLWAFPGLILPELLHGPDIPWRQLVSNAFESPGLARDFFEEILLFLLMFTALLLAIPSMMPGTKCTGREQASK